MDIVIWESEWRVAMTNREYLSTLSNEELSNVIYDIIVDRIGIRYTSSRMGVAEWLGEEYNKTDYMSFNELLMLWAKIDKEDEE